MPSAAILHAAILASLVAPGTDAPPPVVGLHEVPFTQVTIRDAFWSPRRETNRTVSLAHSLDMLEKSGNILDLDLAARGKTEGHKGPVYIDSDLYKALEAVSYSLATDPDPSLEKRLDDIIAKIAAAQRPDGYLDTWYEVHQPGQRFVNLRDHHELYCAGHLFEAGVAHFMATGKRSLLDVATRYADLLCRTFGKGPGLREGYCGHPEIELALVKLSRVTGNQNYFNLASHFIDARGSGFFAREHQTAPDRYDGSYWQDSCPVRDLEHVTGHAVRFGYLLSGAVDVGMQTRDEALLSMARRVWDNTIERNTFITGGVGPSASNEGFTHDYDLPTFSAYQETCASVAMSLWSHRMNLAYADAKYADEVETALYNGVLAGVSLDGTRFFYVNPLASRGGHHRSEWFGCACCPPNVTRTLSSLGNYAYATDDHALWVNLYIAGAMHTTIDAEDLALSVATDYPWDGHVTITIDKSPKAPVPIHLRIPAWCDHASLTVNGKPADAQTRLGYASATNSWKAGDRIELDLPMPVRRVEAHPRAVDCRGRLAIARGPIIYCVEGADADADLWSLAVPAETPLSTDKRSDLLGGIVTISGEAIAGEPEWNARLYRTAPPTRHVKFTAIPYYAWDNRAPGPMQVWLPTAVAPVARGPEGDAKVSVSYESANAEPEGIHDGADIASSDEQPESCCHFWPHKGTTEWVQYTWDQPRTFSGAEAYWFDDTGRGKCRLPKSWRILYLDHAEWKPVPGAGTYEVARDKWCAVRFEPVTTTALRLEVRMRDGFATGIHEWRVSGPEGD